jgi:hypothetical protein
VLAATVAAVAVLDLKTGRSSANGQDRAMVLRGPVWAWLMPRGASPLDAKDAAARLLNRKLRGTYPGHGRPRGVPQTPKPAIAGSFDGPCRNRTYNLGLKRPLLCQLSYARILYIVFKLLRKLCDSLRPCSSGVVIIFNTFASTR